MKYLKAILIILIIVLLSSIFLIQKSKSKVCFDDKCFFVEVVDTPADREVGLMNRDYLDKDSGMFFIFDTAGSYPFWMKNTLIPLDMIWISESGEVVYIEHNAVPCEEDPCPIIRHDGSAKYVLEINGGIASENGIEIGSIAKFVKIEGL